MKMIQPFFLSLQMFTNIFFDGMIGYNAILTLLMSSPEFPSSAAFASPIFLIIATSPALKNISFNLPQKLIQVAGIFLAVTIIYSLTADFSVHSQIDDRAEYISQHKNYKLIIVAPINLSVVTEKIF